MQLFFVTVSFRAEDSIYAVRSLPCSDDKHLGGKRNRGVDLLSTGIPSSIARAQSVIIFWEDLLGLFIP